MQLNALETLNCSTLVRRTYQPAEHPGGGEGVTVGRVSDAIEVGLVGAGPWAAMVHAPVLAAGPETRLAAVWARRPEAAQELAATYGAVACATHEELLDRCEAVAFAVPPDVQADMAVTAARAGKALLLEKPIAGSLDGARRLVEAVDEAGVGTMVVFTARYNAPVLRFLDEAAGFDADGALHENFSGAFLGGPFSKSPWRQEDGGALLDVGPHALDLLTAALGAATSVTASAHGGLVQLGLRHESGAVSSSSMSGRVPGPGVHRLKVVGGAGTLDLDLTELDPGVFGVIRSEFADVVRSGGPHRCDVHRGLEVQVLLDQAQRALAAG
ncbi:Gfo/Idh/MocA family oxidoreductase [soil metagenome]